MAPLLKATALKSRHLAGMLRSKAPPRLGLSTCFARLYQWEEGWVLELMLDRSATY